MFGKDIKWYDIVEEYTQRQITNYEDRLPALAGLAEQYTKATRKCYLAGIWLEDLPLALLWDPCDDYKRPRSYCAPSWSWASVAGHVRFPVSRIGANATVISAHREYRPLGSLSAVKSGWLDIKGKMTVVTKREQRSKALDLFVNNQSRDRRRMYWWMNHSDQDTKCTEEDVSRSRIYLLLVATELRRSYALVLEDVEGESGGKDNFRRLGMARIDGEGASHEFLGYGWESRSIRLI